MSRKNKLKKLRRKSRKWSITGYNRRIEKAKAWADGASYERLNFLLSKEMTADKHSLKAIIEYIVYKAKEL